MNTFISRHSEDITGVLHCFDRIVFQGHLPINYAESLTAFLCRHDVPIEQFSQFVQAHSCRLRTAAETFAAEQGRPCVYMNKPGRKESWAHGIAERDGISEGLVAVLRTTENCRSFSVRRGRFGPRIVSAPRRGLHLYFYFIDPKLGWMHVRLQTWFPFLIQIAVNGHDILARQMDQIDLSYMRHENGFTWLEDPARAQTLAQRHVSWKWSPILNRIARRVNPLLDGLLKGMSYHWVTDQCEMATDILFDDACVLEPLYTQLVRHASLCFTAEDILGFLGRRLHGLFTGEVFNEYKVRPWGTRIKHRVRKNWIKMYNKGGSILRVETVINHAQDFRVYREIRPRKGAPYMGKGPLPKSVAYLKHYWKIQQRANEHYIEALAAVEDPSEAYQALGALTCPARHRKQRQRAINPLNQEDLMLLTAVMRGEYHLQGFRNQHILEALYGRAPKDPKERKRLSARVRRKLLILRAHHLIRRIPRSQRYRITQLGMRLIPAAICCVKQDFPETYLRQAA